MRHTWTTRFVMVTALLLVGACLLFALAQNAGGSGGALGRRVGQGTYLPSVVAGDVVEIGAGDGHSCARLRDDRVSCWGSNMVGQLTGRRHGLDHSLKPLLLTELGPAAQLAVGAAHTCVRHRSRGVTCWGGNVSGSLGREASGSFDLGLVRVRAAADDLSARWSSCTIRWGGAASCWGQNESGRMGFPIEPGEPSSFGLSHVHSEPRAVAGIMPPRQMAIGGHHGCALMPAGTVWCWGLNNFGQRGHGEGRDPLPPAPVPGLDGVVQLSANYFTNCALRRDGTVWCWGRGDRGELGHGERELLQSGIDRLGYWPVPRPVSDLSDVIQVALGGSFACAVKSDGTVWCWGENAAGELGDGTRSARSRPVKVEGVSDAVMVAAGTSPKEAHACALSRRGEVSCWGHNEDGQLGDGSTIGRATAAPVVF